MDADSVNFGSPSNGASPASNLVAAVSADEPLNNNTAEGTSSSHSTRAIKKSRSVPW